MKEQGFNPAAEDANFLKELGGKSELHLSQAEMTYEEHMALIEDTYDRVMDLGFVEDKPGAKREILKQMKELLDSGYNSPEKERAIKDFIQKIEGELNQ